MRYFVKEQKPLQKEMTGLMSKMRHKNKNIMLLHFDSVSKYKNLLSPLTKEALNVFKNTDKSKKKTCSNSVITASFNIFLHLKFMLRFLLTCMQKKIKGP